MRYLTPTTLPEALRFLAGGNVTLVAGGTDYFPGLGDGPARRSVVDVSGLAALRGVTHGDAGWRIGAATTWSDLIRADLPAAFDGLRAAAREVGSVQIQNAGTVGGNLCNASPAADGVPPLLTLDASVELRSLRGSRQVALDDFITGVRRVDLAPDEMLVAVHVPALPASAKGGFQKLGARKYLVISIAMVAAVVSADGAGCIESARIAVGACSAVARRLPGLEAALIGQSAAQLAGPGDLWAAHLGELSPIGDIRGSAEYRREAAAELCRRAVMAALRGVEERVDG